LSGLKNPILPIVALAALALDQASKAWIVGHMALGESRELTLWLAPILSLTHVTNTGVAFGLFQGMSDFFSIVAIVAVVIILLYYRHIPGKPKLLHVALGLQLGGAMGNLVDRLFRGAVVDFIDLNFWPLHHWPIFNLADTSIVAGVGILLFIILTDREKPDPAPDSE
jgi:signal peptidase II